MGHSAGSEIVELAAGLYGGVDAVIPTGYEHAVDGVSSEWLTRAWIPGDGARALQSDYEEFEKGYRDQDMYNLDVADPAVVAQDDALANLTPSGEIGSISEQPSRSVMGNIKVPVLLVLGEKDALFPSSAAQEELGLFSGSTDKQVYVVPDSGHVIALHPNAPQTNQVIGDWLAARVPAC
jgi:pimeloyl-ACP methyl ester carboxylesterase